MDQDVEQVDKDREEIFEIFDDDDDDEGAVGIAIYIFVVASCFSRLSVLVGASKVPAQGGPMPSADEICEAKARGCSTLLMG